MWVFPCVETAEREKVGNGRGGEMICGSQTMAWKGMEEKRK